MECNRILRLKLRNNPFASCFFFFVNLDFLLPHIVEFDHIINLPLLVPEIFGFMCFSTF